MRQLSEYKATEHQLHRANVLYLLVPKILKLQKESGCLYCQGKLSMICYSCYQKEVEQLFLADYELLETLLKIGSLTEQRVLEEILNNQ